MMRSLLVAFLALSTCVAGRAQADAAPVKTHMVNADGSVTFRLSAPHAQAVSISLESVKKPLAMVKDAAGVWSVTTPPLKPQIYDYTFVIDGKHFPDPMNPDLHAGFSSIGSLITVPGTPPMPWELAAVPHGVVAIHRFTTHVAQALPLDQSRYAVYTPPGYDPKKKGGYPVLYLLHGYTDDFDGWLNSGRADRILDALIAQGKAVPMIVVMPLGYGDWNFLTEGMGEWHVPIAVDKNTNLFAEGLETEVMPSVEREYNTARDRNHRAIAGLSMGGLETLQVGLTRPEQFAYVAGFSSAVSNEGFDAHFPNADGKKANFKLLWVSVGVDDNLLQPNRDFVAWANTKGYTVDAVETPGAHEWIVWRDNLVHVLPMLFR
jgi:enterochelin esterase-like enzyme